MGCELRNRYKWRLSLLPAGENFLLSIFTEKSISNMRKPEDTRKHNKDIKENFKIFQSLPTFALLQ
jgi:hypothetical protein